MIGVCYVFKNKKYPKNIPMLRKTVEIGEGGAVIEPPNFLVLEIFSNINKKLCNGGN